MGFLDQAAAKMGDATKAAQDRVAAQQARTAADALLRELGAWTYAEHKGGFPDAAANVTRVMQALAAHEATYGDLGAKPEPPPPPPPPPPPVAESPPPPAPAAPTV